MARLSIVPILVEDGYRIEANVYEPFLRGSYATVAVLNSGAGIPKTFYEPFASWLADSGLPTITYDYRGIGGSRDESIRGLVASIRDWGSKDCAGVLDWAQRRFPLSQLTVIGHSIGGIVTGFVTRPPSIERMLLISPHVGYWRHYDREHLVSMVLMWHVVMPILTTLFGYFPGRLLRLPEDIPYLVALEWAWRRGGRLAPSDNYSSSAAERASRVRARVLSIRPGDDPFATESGLRAVIALFANCTFHDVLIPSNSHKLGHFGFFRYDKREALWQVPLNWLLSGG